MVVFHQGSIGEIHAVINTATGTHRILFNAAQTRGCLASIANTRIGVGDCRDPRAGRGRNATEVAHCVQRWPFGPQEVVGGRCHRHQLRVGLNRGTFLDTHVTCHVIAADHFEDRSSHYKPGDDSTTASHQSQAPTLLHGHGRHRCDINASVDIFFQGPDSQRFNIEGTKARVCEQRNRLGRQSVGRVRHLDLRVLE